MSPRAIGCWKLSLGMLIVPSPLVGAVPSLAMATSTYMPSGRASAFTPLIVSSGTAGPGVVTKTVSTIRVTMVILVVALSPLLSPEPLVVAAAGSQTAIPPTWTPVVTSAGTFTSNGTSTLEPAAHRLRLLAAVAVRDAAEDSREAVTRRQADDLRLVGVVGEDQHTLHRRTGVGVELEEAELGVGRPGQRPRIEPHAVGAARSRRQQHQRRQQRGERQQRGSDRRVIGDWPSRSLCHCVSDRPSGRPAVTGSRWRHAPGRHVPLGSSLSSIGSGRAELQCRTALARRSPIGSRGSSPTGGSAAGSAPGRTAPGLESQRGHRRGHGAVVGAGVLVGGDSELPRHTPGSREVVGAHALAVRVALSHDDAGAAGVVMAECDAHGQGMGTYDFTAAGSVPWKLAITADEYAGTYYSTVATTVATLAL